MSGGSQPDGLDAVSKIAELLKPLAPDVQRRVLRWAQELVGLSPDTSAVPPSAATAATTPVHQQSVETVSRDIRSFLKAKDPKSGQQFAAAVAYFHAFEAPEADRKGEISANDLQEAGRKAGTGVMTNPTSTLNNALRSGYLDKGSKRGTFRINAVGENLVAMTLPGGDGTVQAKPRKKRKSRGRKVARKARRG